jgi:UDP-2,4-diacetamido-2,4,6-trideoxy-beta-L-altropyranose hydrolase
MMLTLRPATMADTELLREWANDPGVRAASFDSSPIDENTHRAWLKAKLTDGKCAFYIAENGRGPIGYARVDVCGRMGEISVSVDAPLRGLGYGRNIITAAMGLAVREFYLDKFWARVKPDNEASLRAFKAAGFVVDGDRLVWSAYAA